jgi:segregation and condensation protein B
MNEQHLKNVVEAALLAAGRPLQPDELRDLFDEFERPEVDEVKAALGALASEYEGRGLELREVSSGFRIQVREAVSAPVSRLWQERPQKYSRAFLETLALIAYRQPITRGEIEEIRGVAVNPNIVKTLMERGWVRVVGHREVPGRPEVLGTTREFLDYFGLKSLDDLPTLAQIRDIETLGVQLEFNATAAPVPEAADAQSAAVAEDAPSVADGAEPADADADAERSNDDVGELEGDGVASARVEGEGAASHPAEDAHASAEGAPVLASDEQAVSPATDDVTVASEADDAFAPSAATVAFDENTAAASGDPVDEDSEFHDAEAVEDVSRTDESVDRAVDERLDEDDDDARAAFAEADAGRRESQD